MESLFINVPLQRTLRIIEDRIYNKKLVKTKLKKSALRKLIRDTCTKTVFSCNNKLCEQTDGVSMGGSLGPVLANIIMTEFEHEIVKKLIDQGLIAFYCRYVDDTLLLIKPTQSTLYWNISTSLTEISVLPMTYSRTPLLTFWISTSPVMALEFTVKILLPGSTLILIVSSLGVSPFVLLG